jgi:L-ascorbate metabolism protein UlaG (beta-lactamase superfamily)
MLTRRTLLATAAAAAGSSTILPYAALAQAQDSHSFDVEGGQIAIHPISHASFVMETPGAVIYADPVGDPAAYADLPAPDLILITHEHGDHYDAETLAALMAEQTQLLTNPAVHEMLPEDLRSRATAIGNGETTQIGGISIEAIPAYNITEDRLQYHPEGRDNGYVLTIGGKRVYIAGDTEGTPEMRALQDIFLAFVPMNLPYTMDVEQAADAVNEFAPEYVYPYHYRDSDPEAFADMVQSSEVRIGDWYGASSA